MSKSFRDTYDSDGDGMRKINKSNKQKRQRVKDYLRHIDLDNIPDGDDLNETLNEEI